MHGANWPMPDVEAGGVKLHLLLSMCPFGSHRAQHLNLDLF
jgi:hypothetical protein